MVLELLDIARVKCSDQNGEIRHVKRKRFGPGCCAAQRHGMDEHHIFKWHPFVQKNHIPNP